MTDSDHEMFQEMAVPDAIGLNRERFHQQNTARLREAVRYLPRRKFKLFNTIPFLLHINSPRFPGYVDHPFATYGIYNFQDSRFWHATLRQLDMSERQMRPYLSRKFFIRGLYLMGSAGTIAQGKRSDFDYWVVVDRAECSEIQMKQLRAKLDLIEAWCRKQYNHDITFFLLDTRQIRDNDYSAVDDESSGSAQKSILKEEFYRTFILVAGQVPFWAVLPAGISDGEYLRWIKEALTADATGFIRESHVDLGNLTRVDRRECLGALLWQIFKARHDPVKSFIKAALVAYYNFFEEAPPCDRIKEQRPVAVGEEELLDPYAVIFDRIHFFFKTFNEETMGRIVQECIFLRLCGYPSLLKPAAGTRKEAAIKAYVEAWEWDIGTVRRFESFGSWPEQEKKAYEELIFGKIAYLYELVMRASEDDTRGIGMEGSDLVQLKNQIARCFQVKPGKIPFCSSYLKARLRLNPFVVSCGLEGEGRFRWEVYEKRLSGSRKPGVPLFAGPELLRVISWIIRNDLIKESAASVVFNTDSCRIPSRIPRQLFREVHEMFESRADRSELRFSEPSWTRLLICLETEVPGVGSTISGISYIFQNSWQEIYFDTVDLSHVESPAIKCYKIADIIWNFLKKSVPAQFRYKIHHFGMERDAAVDRMIENRIEKLQLKALGKHTAAVQAPEDPHDDDTGPLLDLL